MIVGIGSDIVDHKMNSKFLEGEAGIHFIKRILSNEELDIYHQNATDKFIAGRFAAKEATLKCLGTGMQNGLSLNEVSVISSETGQPMINLSGAVKIIADNLGVKKWHVSISHSSFHSTAFVIAET